MKAQTVTIIGLGRVGTALGLAIKKTTLQVSLVGYEPREAFAQKAKEMGAVDKLEWNLLGAAAKADILLLTTPVSELEETLKLIGNELQPHTLLVDFGSLKHPAQKWADKYLKTGHYVGVVPVFAAGFLVDGRSGPETATADLFQKSIMCVMPSVKADPQAVETAVKFGSLIGATPYFLDAMEYDSLVKGADTMPGLVAAAVYNAVHKATGWRDMLRFAGQPFALATLPLEASADIAQHALSDKTATLRWLDAVLAELREVRRWVYEEDGETLGLFLKQLDVERERWLTSRIKNDWDEVEVPEIEDPSLAQRMFGGLAGRGRPSSKDE